MDVPLNDALTGFRIVAVAQAGAAKFGDGMATVRTTQDLMLFSGLPPVVREQDEFTAMFTLRNTTAQPLTARFAWTLRDRPSDDKQGKTLASGSQTVSLAPSEAKLVSVPVKVPVNVERLHWEVSHRRQGWRARPAARHAESDRSASGARVSGDARAARQALEFPVERPAARCPAAAVRVEVMGTLAGEMSAVREYFMRYPYTCLEQRASKAIGLNDDELWQAVAASAPNYLDRDGLARYFPPTGCRAATRSPRIWCRSPTSGREWPEESLNRMLSGLEAFATGRIVRGSALPTADLTVRKLAAIEALARHDRAKPAMLDSITIDPALWPTSALIDWIGILKRVQDVPRRDERLKEALGLLRGRLNFQGTVMTFSTERSDALWWLMVSADVNANRALLAVLDQTGLARGRGPPGARLAVAAESADSGAPRSPTPGARWRLRVSRRRSESPRHRQYRGVARR